MFFRRKNKSSYTPVYEVWEIRKGVYENIERMVDFFYSDKEARAFIIKERDKLWEMGGMRLALSIKYEVRIGREFHK